MFRKLLFLLVLSLLTCGIALGDQNVVVGKKYSGSLPGKNIMNSYGVKLKFTSAEEGKYEGFITLSFPSCYGDLDFTGTDSTGMIELVVQPNSRCDGERKLSLMPEDDGETLKGKMTYADGRVVNVKLSR